MPKLAFAIDDPHMLSILEDLQGLDIILKIGPIIFLKEGFSLIKALKQDGFSIFLDLKFHDIPNTVSKSVEVCADIGIDYLTVHLLGGKEMLTPLKDIKQNTQILGVSILTSHDESYMEFLGSRYNLEDMVMHLASLAYECSLDGIVCSGFEAFKIKNKFKLKTVIPGVRLNKGQKDDQKRVVSIDEIKNVADIIVIGRDIYKRQKPKETVFDILSKLGGIYGTS